MYDIYCSHCGEPQDWESLHDVASDHGITFSVAFKKFKAYGCNVWHGIDSPCTAPVCDPVNAKRASICNATSGIFGDDSIEDYLSLMENVPPWN